MEAQLERQAAEVEEGLEEAEEFNVSPGEPRAAGVGQSCSAQVKWRSLHAGQAGETGRAASAGGS